MSEYEIAKDILELKLRVAQIENVLNAALEADKKAAEEKQTKVK